MTNGSVWEQLAGSPGELADVEVRSALLREINRVVKTWNLSNKESAYRLKLAQCRFSYLKTGKVDKFTIDALVKIAFKAGLKVTLQVTPIN